MKKILTLALAITMAAAGALAQNDAASQSRREIYMQLHKRIPELNQTLLSRGLKSSPKGAAKASTASTLPADRWFPGEWEEVQAICVTWPYICYPANHVGEVTYMADEMVSGYGQYYHYSSGNWQEAGMGPVTNVIDTSEADEDFVQVFANLANAIQQGGAEAWIRICNAEDSNVIKRNLAKRRFATEKIRWIVGSGNSFWYRDCGPICFYYGEGDTLGMLDYMYYPGRALDDSLPYHIERQMGISNWETTLEWEGGNCLVDGTGMCVTSDAIFDNNQDNYGQLSWDGVNPSTIQYTQKRALTKAQVADSMAYLIGSRAMYIIPSLKYDGGTGHVDLYADMWDENEFVFSRFPAIYSNWSDAAIASKNIDTLLNKKSVFGTHYKHMDIPFPKANNGANFSSQTNYDSRYTRTYSNHTFVNNLIIQPCFSDVVNGEPSAPWDRWRIDSLKRSYPGYTIYPINVASFDGSGGAIHCITKQIPAENPVRILHPSITGNTENAFANNDAHIKVIAHNKSGIANAKLTYRVNGGAWQTVDLASSSEISNYGEVFGGTIPAQAIAASGYTTVQYYISVTSHNGKTLTKPMTANQGGYYTYYVGHNPNATVNYDDLYLGIAAANEDGFGQFYPNPSSETATISINAKGACSVCVVDMMGRIMLNNRIAVGSDKYTLNMQGFANGVYTVVFSDNEGHQTVRRIVKR
ncbi:MAG: agmatine deiminase family protein [Bacteroidales bacterium]|nr:agmatine deiminase family protein [Bacteroidales bacterium]